MLDRWRYRWHYWQKSNWGNLQFNLRRIKQITEVSTKNFRERLVKNIMQPSDTKNATKSTWIEQQLRKHEEYEFYEKGIKFIMCNVNRSIEDLKEKFNGDNTEMSDEELTKRRDSIEINIASIGFLSSKVNAIYQAMKKLLWLL